MDVRYERTAHPHQRATQPAIKLRGLAFVVLFLFIKATSTQALAQSTNGPLVLTLEATPDPVRPGGQVSFTITATNSGETDLAEVEVRALLPAYIVQFFGPSVGLPCLSNYCDDGGTLRWELGTLQAGQSQSVSYAVQIEADAPEGALISSTANASGSGGVGATASADVVVDSNQVLTLGMSEGRAPVAPGQRLTYTLTYGNASDASLSDVQLRAPVPEGTRIASASGGGTVRGGEVTWELGSLEPNESGRRTLTVHVDPSASNGQIIEGYAEIASEGGLGSVAQSTAATVTQVEAPLRVALEASPDPVRPGGTVSFTITATNSGETDLAEVEVRALLPAYIVQFFGPSVGLPCLSNYCDDGGTLRWELGTLQAGQSQSVSYAVQIEADAPEGALISSTANVYAEGIGASVSADVVVDSTPETTPLIERTDPEVVTGSVCSQALTLFGRGFTSGSTVTLSNYETAETFTDVPIASQSSTRLTVDYTFPVTAGTWAVEVTDPDGRPSGEFVFEVTEPSEGDAPPAAPTALSADPGDKAVTLSWSASTECDLKEYRLYRGHQRTTHQPSCLDPERHRDLHRYRP